MDWGPDTVYGQSSEFVVLKSIGQVKTVNEVLLSASKKDNATFQGKSTTTFVQDQTQPGPASQKRQEQFILEQSTKSRSALATRIKEKTKQYLAYASPEFTAEFIDKVDKRLNKYTFEFNLPDEIKGNLREKLFSSVKTTFDKELSNLKPKTALNAAIEERVHNLGVLWETGKITKDVKTRTKTTKKSGKKINTTKTYLALRSASGSFLSASSLQATLSILLHDTIKSKFMKPSGARSDPDYLRYQTGRFAQSAMIDSVNYSGDEVIHVQYYYMTDPYEVFTDGGKHGPGRNPENIITAAVRDILIRHVGERFQSVIQMR